jgi:hypothetical protein
MLSIHQYETMKCTIRFFQQHQTLISGFSSASSSSALSLVSSATGLDSSASDLSAVSCASEVSFLSSTAGGVSSFVEGAASVSVPLEGFSSAAFSAGISSGGSEYSYR